MYINSVSQCGLGVVKRRGKRKGGESRFGRLTRHEAIEFIAVAATPLLPSACPALASRLGVALNSANIDSAFC